MTSSVRVRGRVGLTSRFRVRVRVGLTSRVRVRGRGRVARVLEVGLDPCGEGRGGDGDAVDDRVLERVALLAQDVGHRVADLVRARVRLGVREVGDPKPNLNPRPNPHPRP